jgi:hypothetical protein
VEAEQDGEENGACGPYAGQHQGGKGDSGRKSNQALDEPDGR